MKNWVKAEKELNYRIKQEVNKLVNKGYDPGVALKEAREIVKPEIELRAFLIYCANKDNTLDNWLQAKEEFHRRADFYVDVERRADWWEKETCGRLKSPAASMYAELEFIHVRAYFIWKYEHDMKSEWYDSEDSLENEIIERSKDVLKSQPYLSSEEAFYCSKDQFYNEVRKRADEKRKWVSERAYYLSRQNPSNYEEDNWSLALKEFEAEHFIR